VAINYCPKTGKSNIYVGSVLNTIAAGTSKSITLAAQSVCRVDSIILNFVDTDNNMAVAAAQGDISVSALRKVDDKTVSVGLLTETLENTSNLRVSDIGVWITDTDDAITVTNNTDKACIIVIDFIY
jgi:hypothetical protein